MRLVINNVHFEKNVTVQIFESTIRIVGSLLSTHLILTNENPVFGNLKMPDYNGELLEMAHDLVNRLLIGFDTQTGKLQFLSILSCFQEFHIRALT